jgi:hypothetical protein
LSLPNLLALQEKALIVAKMEGAMRNIKLMLSALLLILLSAANLGANQITLDLDTAYVTPTVTPVGISPWLVAEFTDIVPNSVQLTMATTGLATATTQSVGNWFFNVADPLIGLLSFQYTSGSQASIFLAPNLREAGGGQFFDIEFDFASGQFLSGTQSVYLISSLDPSQPISAESFASLSFSSSSQVNYYSAALVEGIGSGLSSWIAAPTVTTPGPGPGPTPVPEPATVILLGLALTGLTFFYGKRNTA